MVEIIVNKPLELILLNWLKVGAKYSSSGRLPDLFLAALGVKYPSESVKNIFKKSVKVNYKKCKQTADCLQI